MKVLKYKGKLGESLFGSSDEEYVNIHPPRKGPIRNSLKNPISLSSGRSTKKVEGYAGESNSLVSVGSAVDKKNTLYERSRIKEDTKKPEISIGEEEKPDAPHKMAKYANQKRHESYVVNFEKKKAEPGQMEKKTNVVRNSIMMPSNTYSVTGRNLKQKKNLK
jgi:hypothetical protein